MKRTRIAAAVAALAATAVPAVMILALTGTGTAETVHCPNQPIATATVAGVDADCKIKLDQNGIDAGATVEFDATAPVATFGAEVGFDGTAIVKAP